LFIMYFVFFFQAEDGIRDFHVTGVQTCALPISLRMISDRIQNIAEGDGDLTIRIDIARKDELGELAGHVNRFMGKLQHLISDIRSEERRVGKEWRYRWWREPLKTKINERLSKAR